MLWLWGPVVLQMFLIFEASSIPQPPEIPGGMPDYVGHAIGYAILGALMLRALAGGRWVGVTFIAALTAAVLSSVYGASDEIHQMFVPGRTPSLADVFADTAGASAAAAVLWTWGILARRTPPTDMEELTIEN